MKQDKSSSSRSIAELGYQGITINVANGEMAKNPLGQDARVRQAFELSIDRDAINQVVFNGEFVAGNQWVPPRTPITSRTCRCRSATSPRPRQLLKEAGVTPIRSLHLMVPNNPESAAGRRR